MTYKHTVALALLLIANVLILAACTGAPAQTSEAAGAAAQLGDTSTPTATVDACAQAKQGDGGICRLHPSTPGTEATPAEAGTPVAVDGGSYTNVSATALAGLLKAKDFKLVNVHIPYAGEIEGTDASVPYDQIEEQLGELPADKTAKIVLYCRSGHMSDIAARALVKLGYSDVWNLEGGTSAWEQAGFSLVNRG